MKAQIRPGRNPCASLPTFHPLPRYGLHSFGYRSLMRVAPRGAALNYFDLKKSAGEE
jgi:hypothetical protein